MQEPQESFEGYVAKYEKLWLKQYDKGVRRNLPMPRRHLRTCC